MKYRVLDKIELLLFILTIFFIPILRLPVRYLIVLWLIVCLINFIVSKDYKKLGKLKFNPLFLFPIFYLLHLIGLIRTEYLSEGLFNLEVKLSFLVVPVLLYFRKSFYAPKKLLTAQVFIYSCIVSFLVNYTSALINYLKTNNVYEFFYYQLAKGFHPTYLSMYIIIAMFFLSEFDAKSIFLNYKYSRLIRGIVFAFFIIYTLMLVSKAAILSLLFLLSIFITLKFLKFLKFKVLIVISVLALFSLQFLLIKNVPVVSYRFSHMSQATQTYISKSDEASPEAFIDGTSLRINLWKKSLKIGFENPIMGTGTGGETIELNKRLESLMTNIQEKTTYNSHNQYLQTFMSLGIPGLTILVLIFIAGLKFCIRNKDILFFYFLSVFAINMLFESILERQLGIIFFVVFYSLFTLWKTHREL